MTHRHTSARFTLWILLAWSMAGCAAACKPKALALDGAEPDTPFVLVLVDKKTEDALGPFPYDRGILAAAVRRSVEFQAKGIVLKFFLDRPRSEQGDRALTDAMAKTKVLLQAGNPGESPAGSIQLPNKFKLRLAAGSHPKAFPASPGGIPLPQFSAAAYDIGFVDFHSIDRMPIIEWYGDKYVKSLFTACLELALNKTAHVTPGESVTVGGKALPLDAYSQAAIRFPEKDDLKYVSLVDFLARTPRPEVKNRIVLLGFDAERFQPIQTPIGPVRPHRIFYYALLSLYRAFSQQGTSSVK